MKTTHLLLTVMVFAALTLAGCSKDDDPTLVTGITLDKTTLTLTVGQTANLTATVLPENAHDKTVVWQSSDTAVATISDAGLVIAISAGSATITAAAGGKSATCVIRVIPTEGVLINGIVWAKTNVDAPGTFAANPEDYGMLYQWNRKTAWSSTEPMISLPVGQNWDSTPAPGDSWDAANNPCPEGWRLPTSAEQRQLYDVDIVNSKWTARNGVNGCEFTDNDSGNTVFFPAVGNRSYSTGELRDSGSEGRYWASNANGTDFAPNMGIRIDYAGWSTSVRSFGFSVRCVLKE